MKNIFLKLKHWQLFLIMCLPPIALWFVMHIWFPSVAKNENVNGPFNLEEIFLYFTIPLTFISSIIRACYMLTILFALNNRMPTELKKNLVFPTISILFPMIYALVMCFLNYYFIQKFSHNDTNIIKVIIEALPSYFLATTIIRPFHLFSIFSSFYSFYIEAKLLKTVEIQQKAEINNYIREFILFWIFIIGIWFIQPRINRIFEQENVTP